MTIPSVIGTPDAQWDGNAESPENMTFDSGTSGSDRCLIVVPVRETTVSAVTYNGVAMTQEIVLSNSGNYIYIFYLVNPATGSNTISVTTASGSDVTILAAVYENVDQVTPLGASTSSDLGTSIGVEELFLFATENVNSKIVMAVAMDGGDAVTDVTPASGMNSIIEDPGDTTNPARAFVTGIYDLDADTASEYDIGATIKSGQDFVMVAIELKESANTAIHTLEFKSGGTPVLTPMTATDFATGMSFSVYREETPAVEEVATSVVAITTIDSDYVQYTVSYPNGAPAGSDVTKFSYDSAIGDISTVSDGIALPDITDQTITTC